MVALASAAPICSRLPGVTPWHIYTITIGSSITANAALIAEWSIRSAPEAKQDLRRAIGASGIVSAFATIATVGAPMDPLPLFGIKVPCWVLVMIRFAPDVAGILELDGGKQESWTTMVKPRIGYAAHLGEAAFGLIYYYGVLRPRAIKTSEVPPKTSCTIASGEAS